MRYSDHMSRVTCSTKQYLISAHKYSLLECTFRTPLWLLTWFHFCSGGIHSLQSVNTIAMYLIMQMVLNAMIFLLNLGMQVTFSDGTITVTEGEAGALVCVQVISGLVERPQPVSVAMGAVENTALGESGTPYTHYEKKKQLYT